MKPLYSTQLTGPGDPFKHPDGWVVAPLVHNEYTTSPQFGKLRSKYFIRSKGLLGEDREPALEQFAHERRTDGGRCDHHCAVDLWKLRESTDNGRRSCGRRPRTAFARTRNHHYSAAQGDEVTQDKLPP
ncbi:MAG TPA: hypothetical protein VGH93_05500 [Solirubrobacteraceae bacterium]